MRSPASSTVLVSRLAVVAVAGFLLVMGCTALPPLPMPDLDERLGSVHPGDWSIHRIQASEPHEPSGMVASRNYPGVLWTHNDSGDTPRLFAINERGEHLAEFVVMGATHNDWEDITADDAGNLYVGDFGNNRNDRRDLAVYRIPEPDPHSAARLARVDAVLPFQYADQRAFPDSRARNFDAEAMFWMKDSLYIFTKHRSDTSTKLYRLPAEPQDGEGDEGEAVSLEPVVTLELGGSRRAFFGNTTGADFEQNEGLLALLTYSTLLFFRYDDSKGEENFELVREIQLDQNRTRQAESVAWVGGTLVFGNEQGYLYRIPDPLAFSFDLYPPR